MWYTNKGTHEDAGEKGNAHWGPGPVRGILQCIRLGMMFDSFIACTESVLSTTLGVVHKPGEYNVWQSPTLSQWDGSLQSPLCQSNEHLAVFCLS